MLHAQRAGMWHDALPPSLQVRERSVQGLSIAKERSAQGLAAAKIRTSEAAEAMRPRLEAVSAARAAAHLRVGHALSARFCIWHLRQRSKLR